MPDLNETASDTREFTPKKFLGGNQKHVLLLVDHLDTPFLHDEDYAFTEKWLAAVGLSVNDVAICNLAGTTCPMAAIKNAFEPNQVFLFGINMERIGLPMQIPHYQVQKYDGQTYLSAPGLQQIAAAQAEKKQFWNCLKTMFPQ